MLLNFCVVNNLILTLADRWHHNCKHLCLTSCTLALAQIPLRRLCDKVQDKFPTKLQTCRGHKSWKSTTQFTSSTFMICVHDFPRGEVSVKVSVMEFGLLRAPVHYSNCRLTRALNAQTQLQWDRYLVPQNAFLVFKIRHFTVTLTVARSLAEVSWQFLMF